MITFPVLSRTIDLYSLIFEIIETEYMKFTLTERGTSAGGEVIEFMKRKPSPNCTDGGTDVSPTAERFCQVTDQYRPPPNYGNTPYKTIHYERQTQLRFKHKFDVDSFCKQLRCWCCQAGCEQGQFILKKKNV
ncbi:MAG: hypothetical protein AYK18_17090 [Theionarchaea archaeon DG-70]|nr:MAG: hypothetical protein AYK18_17090 [Theionarchaea archaeon DG-70]